MWPIEQLYIEVGSNRLIKFHVPEHKIDFIVLRMYNCCKSGNPAKDRDILSAVRGTRAKRVTIFTSTILETWSVDSWQILNLCNCCNFWVLFFYSSKVWPNIFFSFLRRPLNGFPILSNQYVDCVTFQTVWINDVKSD